ncbi:MAG: leucine-rich repeat domain-containing protein [Verrucomicrobia bacterium]|nr:leucine-rich repeat domain-containing protein [Verrucomicrobiota bacterium]
MSSSSIPSLRSLALASASLNLAAVPEEALKRTNTIKFDVWCNLKDEVPAPCRELMEGVEKKVSPDQLQSSVDLLFHRFSNQLTFRYYLVMGPNDGGMIPGLQLHALEKRYQTACENQALETLWTDYLFDEFTDLGAFHLTPPPQGHQEIRAWLTSPDNAAFVQQITYIELMEKGLEYLPPEIGLFTNLDSLAVDKNMLRVLPNSICNLTALKTVSLTLNKLTALPNAFGNLGSLEVVLLGNNRLKSLPNSIGTLVNLRDLQLLSNSLTSIPQSICNLPALETLSLSNNKLCAIPAEIGNLPSLTRLNLMGNFLFTLPASIFNHQGIALDNSVDCMTPLCGNPYIFNMDSNKREHFPAFKAHWEQFIQYSPESTLGKLFHAIGAQKSFEEISKIFASINPIWQEKITECSTEGTASEIASIESEDREALFIARLSASLQMAVSRILSDLPPAQKDKVYHEIARMNGVTENCIEWGKKHAFDHVLIFVDALEKTLLVN